MHWTKHEEDLEEVLPFYKELSSDKAKQRHFVGEREELVRIEEQERRLRMEGESESCLGPLQQKQFTATEAIYCNRTIYSGSVLIGNYSKH